MNWDLRHGTSDRPQVWIHHDDSQLARPIGTKGPWISPGAYTVTLEARDATFTQTMEVRGDPLLSVTQAMYEEREAYLLELLTIGRRIDEARPDLGCGQQCGRTPETEADLCQVQRPSQTTDGSVGGSGRAARLTPSAYSGAHQKKNSDRGSPRPHSAFYERRP